MEQYDIYRYSECLERNMNIKVYGSYGVPLIVFACQDSMSNNFEEQGMIDTLRDYIEEGKIKLYCLDSVDKDACSNLNGDKSYRAWLQDQYFYYVINEVLPIIYETCGGYIEPILTGCSMGAVHTAIMFLRRPDLFRGMLALSGCYDVPGLFFEGWCDDRLFANSPISMIQSMSYDHPYIDIYNNRKMIFCVGQGNWEEEGVRTQRILEEEFRNKGIDAWMDYWGYDVCHDWPWWKVQIRYFLPYLLED